MWARPQAGRIRAWIAVRADQGSTKVTDSWAPKLSTALAMTARKLDPPKPRARRWPRMIAGAALLMAGLAAAAAIASKARARRAAEILPPRPVPPPASGSAVKMQAQQAPKPEAGKQQAQAGTSGMTRGSH